MISERDLTFFDTNIKGKITLYSASRSVADISRITPGIDIGQAAFREGTTQTNATAYTYVCAALDKATRR